jgi:hypothetical protein
MRTGEVELKIHTFYFSALDGKERSASRFGRLNLKETVPGTHWIGNWMGSRSDLYVVAKRKVLAVPGIERQSYSLQASASAGYP